MIGAGITGFANINLSRKYANLEANTAGENQLRAAQAAGIANSQASENALRLAQAQRAKGTIASENALNSAKAAGITGALPSENALRGAQTYSTGQQGGTFAPLARAAINSSAASDDLTGAQTNLTGVQAGVQGLPLSYPMDMALRNYYRQSVWGPSWSLKGGEAPTGPSSGVTMSPVDAAPSYPGTNPSRPYDTTDPNNGAVVQGWNSDGHAAGTANVTPGYAAGTSSVPAKGAKPNMKGPGNKTQVAANPPQPMMTPDGRMDFHAVMAHAMGSLHAAGGATNVPAPGQTITSGSWAGPTAPSPPPAPLPPTPLTGGDLRARLGMGKVRAAGGATDIRPPMGAPPIAPPVAYPTPPGTPAGTFGTRTPLTGTVKAAGGATNIINARNDFNSGDAFGVSNDPAAGNGFGTGGAPQSAGADPYGRTDFSNPYGANFTDPYGRKFAGGTANVNAKGGKTTVPGNGPPNVDSVPATLAPQEAVLNAGAAHHLGRGTISMLNALGAAKMAQAGMPPATPPTAHGMPVKAAGKPQAKPMARGMPKPAAKPSAQKVAPKAKTA